VAELHSTMKPLVTADCDPTLNDSQVLEFCRNGYLMFESVVPEEINRNVLEVIETDGYGALHQKTWFVEHVLLNRQVAGAIRALLGKDFGLPIGVYNHRAECPQSAQFWHRDGGSRYGPETNHLQVFYYPQDTPQALGPTDVLPGSHFLFQLQSWMGHYSGIASSVTTAAPAGSIFVTAYPIWHRRGKSTAHAIRHMLKYCYWRTAPPQRDWIIESDFDFAMAPYSLEGLPREQFRDWYDTATMLLWLCGDADKITELLGCEDWPMGYPPPQVGEQIYPPKGFYRFSRSTEMK